MEEKIGVIDNGGQYAHLICLKIRQLGVYSELLSTNLEKEKIKEYKGFILSGSPYSVNDRKAPRVSKAIFLSEKPILGICYGMQYIAKVFGGEVKKLQAREYSKAIMKADNSSPLFLGLDKSQEVWMSHGDSVIKLPKGFKVIGFTDNCKIAAFENSDKRIYGVQFHPEVSDTKYGNKILENFVFRICGASKNWNMEKYLEKKLYEIKEHTYNKKVVLLASGGVDSTVLAFMLAKALPKENVKVFHINTGFMRKNESEKVASALRKAGIVPEIINAESDFYNAIKDIKDPEEKRKIIGEKFISIIEPKLNQLDNWVLCQGTIYPDTIESGATKHSEVIKTHHNRVGIIQRMIKKGLVLEPLSDLYKEEVRVLGRILKVPEEILKNHPFPGPGLAVRIITVKTPKPGLQEKLEKVLKHTRYKGLVLPLKSVGVKGDARCYEHPVVLFGPKNWDELEKISIKITNNIEGINRVVFSLQPKTFKKPKTIEDEINKEKIELLREADYIVEKIMRKSNYYDKVWQFPVIYAPISFTESGGTIILRPVISKRAMTARFAKLPWGLVDEVKKELLKLEGVNAIFYDITNKPPATIEWE